MQWMKSMMVAVAGLGLVAAAGAVYQQHSCSAGGQCAAPTASAVHAGSRDPMMSLVCQRSCAAKESYRAADLVEQPHARVHDLTRCPVSGVVFRVPENGPHAEYANHTYYMCCDNCVQKFAARPVKFLGG